MTLNTLSQLTTIVDLASNTILFNLCKMLSPPWALNLTRRKQLLFQYYYFIFLLGNLTIAGQELTTKDYTEHLKEPRSKYLLVFLSHPPSALLYEHGLILLWKCILPDHSPSSSAEADPPKCRPAQLFSLAESVTVAAGYPHCPAGQVSPMMKPKKKKVLEGRGRKIPDENPSNPCIQPCLKSGSFLEFH